MYLKNCRSSFLLYYISIHYTVDGFWLGFILIEEITFKDWSSPWNQTMVGHILIFLEQRVVRSPIDDQHRTNNKASQAFFLIALRVSGAGTAPIYIHFIFLPSLACSFSGDRVSICNFKMDLSFLSLFS